MTKRELIVDGVNVLKHEWSPDVPEAEVEALICAHGHVTGPQVVEYARGLHYTLYIAAKRLLGMYTSLMSRFETETNGLRAQLSAERRNVTLLREQVEGQKISRTREITELNSKLATVTMQKDTAEKAQAILRDRENVYHKQVRDLEQALHTSNSERDHAFRSQEDAEKKVYDLQMRLNDKTEAVKYWKHKAQAQPTVINLTGPLTIHQNVGC